MAVNPWTPTRPVMSSRHDERGGAGSAWIALLVMVMIMTIGISVDLTGLINAKQKAFDLAHQAGRAAANQIHEGEAMTGQTPSIDVGAASAAASGFLSADGADGSVSVTGPQSLHVSVSVVYQPKILSFLGSRTVAGDADISLTRVVDGSQR